MDTFLSEDYVTKMIEERFPEFKDSMKIRETLDGKVTGLFFSKHEFYWIIFRKKG